MYIFNEAMVGILYPYPKHYRWNQRGMFTLVLQNHVDGLAQDCIPMH